MAIRDVLSQLRDLPGEPRRITLHWTGGGPQPNATDLRRYHALVGQDLSVTAGVPIAWNMRSIPRGTPMTEYAAHAGGANSWNIGVALCGMMEAKEGGSHGPHPITEQQMRITCGLVAQMARILGMPVDVDTVIHHWELYHIGGIGDPGKWDITVLPWLPDLREIEVGPWIRDQVRQAVYHPTDYAPEIRDLPADLQRPHGTPPWRRPLRRIED